MLSPYCQQQQGTIGCADEKGCVALLNNGGKMSPSIYKHLLVYQ